MDYHRPEIERLFDLALDGRLPRRRELKPWEPDRLNERHLSMVMMRAGGLKQRQIARAFGATDANVSVVLNHPDAEYLLVRLQAMKATAPTSVERRLAALSEPAVDALEAVFNSEEVDSLTFKRAPLAFKVLEFNGYGRKKVEVEHEHRHSLSGASSEQLERLTDALKASRSIPESEVARFSAAPGSGEGAEEPLEADFEVLPASGAGSETSEADSPPFLLPSGAAAPSSGRSQAPDRRPLGEKLAELKAKKAEEAV